MKVGFIGLGTMGRPMALNLIKHQHELTVFARRTVSLEPLVERGAVVADSPAGVAADCDAVFTMLTGTEDVESVVLGVLVRSLLIQVRLIPRVPARLGTD